MFACFYLCFVRFVVGRCLVTSFGARGVCAYILIFRLSLGFQSRAPAAKVPRRTVKPQRERLSENSKAPELIQACRHPVTLPQRAKPQSKSITELGDN